MAWKSQLVLNRGGNNLRTDSSMVIRCVYSCSQSKPPVGINVKTLCPHSVVGFSSEKALVEILIENFHLVPVHTWVLEPSNVSTGQFVYWSVGQNSVKTSKEQQKPIQSNRISTRVPTKMLLMTIMMEIFLIFQWIFVH